MAGGLLANRRKLEHEVSAACEDGIGDTQFMTTELCSSPNTLKARPKFGEEVIKVDCDGELTLQLLEGGGVD